MKKESDIFVRDKLTDFEKLLFAQKAIKDLQIENRNLRQKNELLNSSVNEFEKLFSASDKEKAQYKQDKYYRHISDRLIEMRAKLRRLKNENIELQIRLFKH